MGVGTRVGDEVSVAVGFLVGVAVIVGICVTVIVGEGTGVDVLVRVGGDIDGESSLSALQAVKNTEINNKKPNRNCDFFCIGVHSF